MTEERWPDFFIIGAAKCGTTSLATYCGSHPQVFMAPVKEPHFFSRPFPAKAQRSFVRPILRKDDYLRLFKEATDDQILGEASPSYLPSADAATRIHAANPAARVVVLLRDPVERAYSHFLMDVRDGIQALPFPQALQEDYLSVDKGWGRSHLYIELGLYTDQLGPYLEVFGRERCFIAEFELLRTNPTELLNDLAAFLEIDAALFSDVNIGKRHNPYAAPRSQITSAFMRSNLRGPAARFAPSWLRRFVKDRVLTRQARRPPIDDNARKFLQDIYRPDIARLEALLGKKMPSLHAGW